MSLFSFSRRLSAEVIAGERVYLRPPRTSDFAEWASLRQASRAFLEPWEPSWTADEFSRSSYRLRLSIYEQRAAQDQAFTYYVFDSATEQLVGGLSLSHVRRGVSQAATLGYWMGEAFAGRGLMKDALQAVAGCAASRFHLHRLEAACLPHNERSRRLLLGCGFEEEGQARSYVKIAGRWEDHLLYGRVIDESW